MKNVKGIFLISLAWSLVLAFVILQLVAMHNNDFMSLTDKENFKELKTLIQKDVLYGGEIKADKLSYTLSGDLRVTNHKDAFTYSALMGIVSINTCYGIKEFSLTQYDHLVVIPSNSDWLSPYQVKSEDDDAHLAALPQFTGGWHGSNGDSTGPATSFMKSFQIFADGKEIIGHTAGQAQTINIIVNQIIKGYNTDNYVLEEYILYTLQNNKVQMRVKIVALQNVVIEEYYGLETLNAQFNEFVHYHYEDGTSYTQSLQNFSQSGPNSALNHVTSLTLSSTEHPFILRASLLYAEHLKPFPHLTPDQPEAFTESYGKSYYNIVRGQPLIMKTGQVFKWAGSLQFTSQ